MHSEMVPQLATVTFVINRFGDIADTLGFKNAGRCIISLSGFAAKGTGACETMPREQRVEN